MPLARILAVWTAVFSSGAAVAHADDPPKVTAARPTLFLIGDSTVKTPTKGQLGWGDSIAALFDPAKVRVDNRARGGRSSRTYLTEGLWDAVVADLKAGDFVLIQFGHNDGGPVSEGRARASLKGTSEDVQIVVDAKTGKEELVHTYGWYLRKYADDAVAKGATPIVVSPVPRNIWKADGTVARASNDYGKWAAEAAKKSGALFIDLNDLVARRYEGIGRDRVTAEFFGTDHTHTTPAGAEVTALVIAEAIRGLDSCPLRKCLAAARP